MFLFLLGRGLENNVDIIASKFAGETDVLALFTDSDGLLVLGNVNLGFLAIDVDLHDFSRTEGFTNILGSVIAPVDDVDFLAVADFVHDGLDADATTADEGTDWIDAGNGGSDGDFGAAAGFAGDAFDFDGAVSDFRNFLFEESLDEFGAAAG